MRAQIRGAASYLMLVGCAGIGLMGACGSEDQKKKSPGTAVFVPGERLSVYLKGALVSEQTGAQVVAGASSSTTPLLLGRNNLGYYAGSLDEVRVYARALSLSELVALAAL